jgi:hypothetical protein
LFVIEFLLKTQLADVAGLDDVVWHRMLTTYETEEAANDNRLWHELEDSSYEYRVREVA